MLKKIILVITLLTAIAGALYFLLTSGTYSDKYSDSKIENALKPYLLIGTEKIYVEIADNEAKHSQGLSGRASLAQDTGMLFIFETKQTPSFWMRGMNFGLDFIWIKDKKIIASTKNIPAPIYGEVLETYMPPEPIDNVLEVNAGWIKKHFSGQSIINMEVQYFLQ